MRVVAFSDWRVQSIQKLKEFIINLDPKPSVITYSGDDLKRFTDGENNQFEELAKFSKNGFVGVAGNDDDIAIKWLLKGNNVFDVHNEPIEIDDYLFVGQEGSTRIGLTVYNEKEIAQHLQEISKTIDDKKVILVSHSPPKGCLDYGVRFGFDSIGSQSIREFIEKQKPLMVICGHVHSYGGQSEKIKETTVVNVASHDSRGSIGNVAVIDIVDNWITIEWHKITEKKEKNNDISSVTDLAMYSGKGNRVFDLFRKVGIHSLDHLLSSDTEILSIKTGLKKGVINRGKLYAKALQEKKVFFIKPFNLPKGDRIYCDIETNIANNFVWIIGVLYDYETGKTTFKQFTADSRKDEKNIISNFLLSLERFRGTFVYSSNSNFEERVLNARINKLTPNLSGIFTKLVKIDLGLEFQRGILVSPFGYSPKTLSKMFGYNYKHDLTGWTAGVECERFLRSKDPGEKKRIIKRLCMYNKDDVYAIRHIVKALNL